MSDLLREEFDAWFSVNAPDINNLAAARVAKHMMIKELAFLTWQASRECLVIELPEKRYDWRADYVGILEDSEGKLVDIDSVSELIHAAGVKTK